MAETWLTPAQERAWRAHVRLSSELAARLNRQLQVDSGLSLADYEVLVHLTDVPEGRLRPYELERRMGWEQSRLSHHLTRMQRRGLIVRAECPDDHRGILVALTPAGRRTIERAAPGHVAAVRKLFFDALTQAQVGDFERLTTQVLDRLHSPADVADSRERGRDVREMRSARAPGH